MLPKRTKKAAMRLVLQIEGEVQNVKLPFIVETMEKGNEVIVTIPYLEGEITLAGRLIGAKEPAGA